MTPWPRAIEEWYFCAVYEFADFSNSLRPNLPIRMVNCLSAGVSFATHAGISGGHKLVCHKFSTRRRVQVDSIDFEFNIRIDRPICTVATCFICPSIRWNVSPSVIPTISWLRFDEPDILELWRRMRHFKLKFRSLEPMECADRSSCEFHFGQSANISVHLWSCVVDREILY